MYLRNVCVYSSITPNLNSKKNTNKELARVVFKLSFNSRLPHSREEPLTATGTKSENFSEKEECSKCLYIKL